MSDGIERCKEKPLVRKTRAVGSLRGRLGSTRALALGEVLDNRRSTKAQNRYGTVDDVSSQPPKVVVVYPLPYFRKTTRDTCNIYALKSVHHED